MTTHRAVRRAAAASAAAVLALTLTACGDDASKAGDASSSGTTTGAALDQPEAGQTVDPTTFVDDVLGGMTDLTTAHMEMSLEGGPAEVAMKGDVDYSTTPPEMAMTMSGAMGSLGEGHDIEVRLVDGTMYLQMPFGQADKWVKLDIGSKGGPLSQDLVDQMNPSKQLETMKDAITEVTYVGQDGTGDHYTLTVRSEAFRELQDQLGGSEGADLPSVLTYDLWTDDQGRIAKSEIALGDLGKVTITLSDWDEDVDIQAPPEGDVVEMPDGMMPGTSSS